MRNLIGLLSALLILTSCEVTEETQVVDYSTLKTMLQNKPAIWDSYINNKSYDKALILTYPNSYFESLTNSEKWAYENTRREYTYDFESIEIELPFFEPDKGTVTLLGKISINASEYKKCRVFLKLLNETNKMIDANWKLESLIVYP